MKRLIPFAERLEIKLLKPLPSTDAELAIELLSQSYPLSRAAKITWLRHRYFNYDRLVKVLYVQYKRSRHVRNEEYVEAVALLRHRVNQLAILHLRQLKSRPRKPLAS
jgi:hypothetical protein